MSGVCVACGAALANSTRFCAHCGTANEPDEAPTPLIDAALDGGLATAVASGRKLDGKAAPIVYGQRTTLEGAETAVKPKPIPWKERPVAAPDSPTAPGAGRPRSALVLAIVAALALVPGALGAWTSANLGSASAVADRFASLHTRPAVASALGDALADELVAAKFTRPERHDEAATKATKIIEAPGFAESWKTIVTNAQKLAADGQDSEQPSAVGLDLTRVLDHLRLDGIAAPNAQVAPIALGPSGASAPARGFLGAAFIGSLVCLIVSALAALSALALAATSRRSVVRRFGQVLLGWSLALSAVIAFGSSSFVGSPPSDAVRPVTDAVRASIVAGLVTVGLGAALVGLVVTGLTMIGGRHDSVDVRGAS